MEIVKKARQIIEESPQYHNNITLACKPSDYDSRDYKYHLLLPYKQNVVKDSKNYVVDYRKNLPPVWNQGNLGSCTCASSCWGFKAYQEIEQGDFPNHGLSVAYLYSLAKNNDGDPSQPGSQLKVVMKMLQQYGVCTEDKYPYNVLTRDYNLPLPPAELNTEAANYKINTYAQICDSTDATDNRKLEARIDKLRQAILNEGPIEIAIIVTDNFMNLPPDYILEFPEGRILGGHALCLCGFNDQKELFIVRNTWSENWGDKGYCYMPYKWVTYTFSYDDVHPIPFFLEAWSSVDVVVPKVAKTIQLIIGKNTALVDNIEIYLDQPPIVKNNRTLVPLRFLADNLGFLTNYNNDTITLQKPDGSLSIVLQIGQNIAHVNGKIFNLDQPPIIDESTNRTLVPVRFISETTNYDVQWNQDLQTILVKQK